MPGQVQTCGLSPVFCMNSNGRPCDSESCRDGQIALLPLPTITEIEVEGWRSIILIQVREFGLVMLLKDRNRPDIIAEDADVPFVLIEIGNRNPSIVLHDGFAVSENEIADAVEPAFEHQVRGGFQETSADAEVIAKAEKAGR